MKLHNEFTVPLPPQEAWDLLNQVERVAPCFPGTQLLETHDDGSFVGTVSVRLGPVALSFKGTAIYEEVDPQAMRVKVRATGNEQRARGSASANVVFVVTPDAAGSRVLIDTELQLVGTIAQYARGGGMIEATAQVMIDDFAANLKAQLDHDEPGEDDGVSDAKPTEHSEDSGTVRPPSALRILWLALRNWLFRSREK